jgi:hypothetical protein
LTLYANTFCGVRKPCPERVSLRMAERSHRCCSARARFRIVVIFVIEATDNDTEDGDEKGQTPGLELGAIRHFLPLVNGNVAMGGP